MITEIGAASHLLAQPIEGCRVVKSTMTNSLGTWHFRLLVPRPDYQKRMRSFRVAEVERSKSAFISRRIAHGSTYAMAIRQYENSRLRIAHREYLWKAGVRS